MNAVRIRKKLVSDIPQLPELTPLVGRVVEIIVLDDSDAESESSNLPSLKADKDSPPLPARFDDLVGGWPEDQLDDGFEESVSELRRGPWCRGID